MRPRSDSRTPRTGALALPPFPNLFVSRDPGAASQPLPPAAPPSRCNPWRPRPRFIARSHLRSVPRHWRQQTPSAASDTHRTGAPSPPHQCARGPNSMRCEPHPLRSPRPTRRSKLTFDSPFAAALMFVAEFVCHGRATTYYLTSSRPARRPTSIQSTESRNWSPQLANRTAMRVFLGTGGLKRVIAPDVAEAKCGGV
jgi:hypothetical protein